MMISGSSKLRVCDCESATCADLPIISATRPLAKQLLPPSASNTPWHLRLRLHLHLTCTHLPLPCMRLHLPPPATCLRLQPQERSKRAARAAASWELAVVELGSCNSAGCSRFLSFRPGQLLQATPPILSCVPSQLHLTNCFVSSVHRPWSTTSTSRPSSITAHHHPGEDGNLDAGTMGMLSKRDETALRTRAGLGTMTSLLPLPPSFCPPALLRRASAPPPPGSLPSTPPLFQRRSSSNSHHCSMLILGSQLGALKPCFSPFFLLRNHTLTLTLKLTDRPARLPALLALCSSTVVMVLQVL